MSSNITIFPASFAASVPLPIAKPTSARFRAGALAAKAMRVLAFGYSEKDLVENKINDDVVIIGLVGIRDDVRYGIYPLEAPLQ